MKHIPVILLLIFIIGCSTKEPVLHDLDSKYWNLIVDGNDSNLIEYKDQALYFDNGAAYFFNKRIANYSISNDTLTICDTAYYEKWIIEQGIQSSAKVDIKFHKLIKNDSLYRVTYKYLIGRILKSDNDSLIIQKIEGYGFPFQYQKLYKFYNDTLQFDLSISIDTLEFSSSLCDGKCPAIALKIDKGLNINSWGGRYSNKPGFRKGQISKMQFEKIESLIRIANIKKNDTLFYPPMDAPCVELIIDYNTNMTKRFWGYLWDFPPRIKNIGLEMFELFTTSSIDSCDCEINFEVELDNPEKRLPPPPPPPD